MTGLSIGSPHGDAIAAPDSGWLDRRYRRPNKAGNEIVTERIRLSAAQTAFIESGVAVVAAASIWVKFSATKVLNW